MPHSPDCGCVVDETLWPATKILCERHVREYYGMTENQIRTFSTGATRDIDTTKNDYEGFLSPLVLERFGDYMTKHRVQKDGSIRDSDNWQKGIPLSAYMKSGWRHFLQWWKLYRGYPIHSMGWSKWPDGENREPEDIEEVLCAMLFNVQGYLHEVLKKKEAK